MSEGGINHASNTARQGNYFARFKRQLREIVQLSSTNRVNQRLFRSVHAIQKEQERQRRVNPYIIHPFSQFRWYWDLVMVVTLGVTLLVLPIEIAFYTDADDDPYQAWMGINIFVDIIFLVDIAFNFRTGYVTPYVDEVEIDSKKVALHYLKSWFIVDLVSSVPLDYLYKAATMGNGMKESFFMTLRMLRLTKVLSLLRIFRMARLVRYVYKIQEVLELEGKVISMVNLITLAFLFVHWDGCLQYLSVFLGGITEDSWPIDDHLVAIVGNSTVKIADTWTIYSRSIWRAMSHMLSIGYGVHAPVTLLDTWMVILSMVIGCSLYALFIGSMSGLIMSLNLSGKKYDEMIDEVKQYMRFRRVPLKTQKRVFDYYEHRYQRKFFDENMILYESSTLTDTLRQEILLHNCRELVFKVPFLMNASSDFLYDIIRKLHFEVYFPGDVIIQAGKKGDSMYFIDHGLVDVIASNKKVINSLEDGNYFGEMALLWEERRVATIVAMEITDVYCLKKVDFDMVLIEYPEMKRFLEIKAHQRMSQLSSAQGDNPSPSYLRNSPNLLDNAAAEEIVPTTSAKDSTPYNSENNVKLVINLEGDVKSEDNKHQTPSEQLTRDDQ